MNSSPITMIKWLQGYENLFMAAFQDGTIMLFDKEKEDDTFHPGDEQRPTLKKPILDDKQLFKITKPSSKSSMKSNPVSHWKLSNQSITGKKKYFNFSTIFFNPFFFVCVAFAFSPDCQHVAIVGHDGLLRVVNFLHET